MTKEEKIKEEWVAIYGEEKYNLIKYAISENGYICSIRFPEISKIINTTEKGIQWGTTIYSPINLKGVSDNNGWIKIESKESLPKEYDFYDACCFNEKIKNDVPMFYGCNLPDLRNYFDEELITHYRPAIKHAYPLF